MTTEHNDMSTMIADAFARLLADRASRQQLDGIETKHDASALWAHFEESGFLDVQVPEEYGGAGQSLEDTFPLLSQAGYWGLPLPCAPTQLARAWLHSAGFTPPSGAVTFARVHQDDDGDAWVSSHVPFGKFSDWVLAQVDDTTAVLLSVDQAQQQGCSGRTDAEVSMTWPDADGTAQRIPFDPQSLASVGSLMAIAFSALLSGAADRVLELTVDYANQRSQFGRSIGRFQAVQNQMSTMAERVWAMRMAARLACQDAGPAAQYAMAAAAKATCSESASHVTDVAHAVHGAMGITQEYDLQLYTRRMHEWRRAGGAENYWASQLGRRVLAQKDSSALDFIIQQVG